MIEVNWTPDRRTLRQFGLIGLGVLGAMSAVGVWRNGPTYWSVSLGAAAVAFGVLGLVVPLALKYVFIGMSVVSAPIGFVVSHAILGLVYFGLFTPLALVFRVIGRDSMARSFDRSAKSYWTERRTAGTAAAYFRQY